VNWRGRAGKVVNFVHLNIQREADVVAHDFKIGIFQQVGNIASPAGIEVIKTEHFMFLGEEFFA
jgi:hypothetical protein